MGEYVGGFAVWEYYLIYLRKSRQDDPTETVEEVLAKHEMQLQEYAMREFGGRIPEENIYREVVSGESIDERAEMRKLLTRIEEPTVKGVLVIDPQRLSRGDLEDCGRLINDFRYTNTRVVSLMMTYDLSNKMDRRFLQDELLRGRDYLEYIKETLKRGRESAVRRGCYISPTAPFGFNKIKIGRDWTLEANDDAEAVRLMYGWYVNEGASLGVIARRLDELGYKAPQGEQWSRRSLREMLLNVHYIGKVRYNNKQSVTRLEEGERVRKMVNRPEDEVIIAEGKHEGIIPPELFEAARVRLKNTPRNSSDEHLVNVLAGVLTCAQCGRVMIIRRSKTARPRYMCSSKKQCTKSAVSDDVLGAVIQALEQSELPKLRAKLANDEGDAAAIQKKRIAKLVKQMEEYRMQEDHQYELLETRKYTQELFDRRNAALRAKMEACEKEMRQARAAMPKKKVDYQERIIALEDAIAALRDPEVSNRDANRLLRSIVERIDFRSTPVGSKETDVKLDVFLRL